jgi:hypothetical protein
MRKQFMLLSLLSVLALGLAVIPIQADFMQCPDGGCNGTDNADVINGSPGDDLIEGLDGDDFIFGNNGSDELDGQGGNDFLLGGPGDDFIFGDIGNDIIFPGPDGAPDFFQEADGEEGNDVTNVLVGEISGCLIILDEGGFDIVNLIGFGPYVAVDPFGEPDLEDGWILVVDPITGGNIIILVEPIGDAGIEVINGLLTPNIIVIDEDQFPLECQEE